MTDFIRLGIIDDHPVFRRGLLELLSETEDIAVLWTASTVDEMHSLLAAGAERPDLILLDRQLRGGGPQNARAVSAVVGEGFCVLVVSTTDARGAVETALAAGARGYVSKLALEDEVVAAIYEVVQGGIYVSPQLGDIQSLTAGGTLTPRELEIVRLLARGLSDAAVGRKLHISITTVRTHLDRIEEKIGVRRRGMIVRWAIENGYISPEEEDG